MFLFFIFRISIFSLVSQIVEEESRFVFASMRTPPPFFFILVTIKYGVSFYLYLFQ